MSELTMEQAIQTLEDLNGIQFSDEQLAILKAPRNHPTVVNACAGSGKTTIFVYKAILNMLVGRSNGHDTYGITFSKDAQLEMQQRFEHIRGQLVQSGIRPQSLVDSAPQFKTFHALFFQLLKSYYPGLKVLASPESNPKIRYPLYRILNRSKYETDNKEVLQQIFAMQGEMINRGWSSDGLDIPELDDEENPIQHVVPELNIPSHSQKFLEDYVQVIQTYQRLKDSMGLVDFSDMKIILYQKLFDDENARTYFLQQMKPYRYIFLDEFQDIDHLQWQLVKLLISKAAKRNLFVIGDDDQAIYGFRGGSAKYIINFKKNFPRAKQYNLSTNYRTGGKILDTARKMITGNPVRIDKHLYAAKQDHGKIYTHHDHFRTPLRDNPVFQHLLKVTNDPNIPSRDIAVLVRHNTTRSMVSDFLANHGIYGDISHPVYILQRNKVYKTYTDLMYALLYDDFDHFYPHAKEIGFTNYRQHVKSVVYHQGYRLNQVHKLSLYCAFAAHDYKIDRKSTKGQRHMRELDDDVRKYYKQIQNAPARTPKQNRDLLERAYHNVAELVGKYYSFMTRKHFMSSADYFMAKNTLQSNLPNERDTDFERSQDFFAHEQNKDHNVDEVVQGNKSRDLDILTLHQAKGLQYKHVFLIGLDNTDFDEESVILSKLFPSDCSYEGFLKTLYDSLPADDDDIEAEEEMYGGDDDDWADDWDDDVTDQEDLCEKIWKGSLDDDHERIPAKAFQSMYDIHVRGILAPQKDDEQFHFVDKDHYVENHQHKVKKIKITKDNEGDAIPPITKYIDTDTGEILTLRKKLSNHERQSYEKKVDKVYRTMLFNAEFVESERKLLYVGITRSQDYMYLDIPAFANPLLKELDLRQSKDEHAHEPLTVAEGRPAPQVHDIPLGLDDQDSQDSSGADDENLFRDIKNGTNTMEVSTSKGDFPNESKLSKVYDVNQIDPAESARASQGIEDLIDRYGQDVSDHTTRPEKKTAPKKQGMTSKELKNDDDLARKAIRAINAYNKKHNGFDE